MFEPALHGHIKRGFPKIGGYLILIVRTISFWGLFRSEGLGFDSGYSRVMEGSAMVLLRPRHILAECSPIYRCYRSLLSQGSEVCYNYVVMKGVYRPNVTPKP